jgi:hypothetical protein
MLSEFLTTHRETIIANSRAKVASRAAPRPTPTELETGVPLFLDQLVATLRIEESTRGRPSDHQIGLSAAKHGKALHKIGFTVAQVIHDYGDICQASIELADELDAPITAAEFRTLNRCLDEAMAEAVSEFGRQRELSISNDETERLGFFAHELRNVLSNSMLAFEVLKSGSGEDHWRERALEAGATDVLMKPFDPPSLITRIAAAVAPGRSGPH